MDELLLKLQALRGTTIDDKMISDLLNGLPENISDASIAATEKGGSQVLVDDSHSVDDLLIASKAAEMEFESMRRYFSTPERPRTAGIDGLKDEDVSSDSDDEVIRECSKAENSNLDKLLAKNSLVYVNDEEEADTVAENNENTDGVDLSSVPQTIMVPYGAKFIPLGTIQSVVDGLLVISEGNLIEDNASASNNERVACDVESLVFIANSNPLTVIGMIVDTLGTVKNPIHLVVVTNRDQFSLLSSTDSLIGSSVCTLSSHAKVVEIDDICGQAVIKGSPQLVDYEDGDDDGADEEESNPIAIMDIMAQTHSGTTEPSPRPPNFGYGYSRAPYMSRR